MLSRTILLDKQLTFPLCRWSAGILMLLDKNSMRPGQISSSLGTSLEIVRMKLRLLKQAGLVTRDRSGMYLISNSGKELYSSMRNLFLLGLEHKAFYEVLSCKWMKSILLLVSNGGRRWRDIISLLRPISSKVLSEKLQRLESLGLVRRTISYTRPPSVSYWATETGQMLARWLKQYTM
jgi:DNA-binding HxlR family transcriptional regulator